MELSGEDIARLTSLGFRLEEIRVIDDDGLARLRNVDGRCIFLSKDERSCIVYDNRPRGCEIYPVNCDQEGNVFVDQFCKACGTVSKSELRRKAVALMEHLEVVDDEAKARKCRSKRK